MSAWSLILVSRDGFHVPRFEPLLTSGDVSVLVVCRNG